MSDSNLYTAAQKKSQYSNNTSDGFLGFQALEKELKKTQVRECQPYHLLLEICKHLKIKRADCYGKILFSNSTGQVKLLITRAKNTDQAAMSKEKFVYVADVIEAKIQSNAVISENKQSSEAIDEKNKSILGGQNILRKDEEEKSVRPSKQSLAYRKKRRRKNFQSKLKSQQNLKNQITLTDFYSQSPNTPEAFNTVKASASPKDFASIFEDANNNLYDENLELDIEIENPPGVAKYIGLGIDIDRPSVIMSTEISPIIYDDSLDVYEKMILDRQYRLESVYSSLENVNLEEFDADVTKQIELLSETQSLIKDGLTTIRSITSLDDEIIQEISVNMYDLARTLGYGKNLKLTQIYAQVLFDMGAFSEFGVFNTQVGDRPFFGTDISQVAISNNYRPQLFSGKSIYNSVLRSSGQYKSPKDSNTFAFGNSNLDCSFLAYQQLVDSPKNRDGVNNLGQSGITLDTRFTEKESLMQAIFSELVLSRLAADGDENVLSLKSSGTTNLVSEFMGSFGNSANSLNSIKSPEKLAAILKFRYSGENFYPLEQFIASSSGLNGRTFLDAVVQPAIGSIIEDKDPNFNLLNAWVENANTSLNDSLRYLDPIIFDGGSTIILNEIILAAIKCVSEPNAKVGGRKHPFSQSMRKLTTELSPEQVAAILKEGIEHFSNGSSKSLGHIYNTIGYNFFAGQIEMLQKLAGINSTGLDMTGVDYKLGHHNWDSSYPRDLSDTANTNRSLNNIYEEFSRFFQILENGIMTSIELLLADSGLLKANPNNDYLSPVGEFFIRDQASTRKSGVSSDAGTYEKTSFSGIPRLYLRALLAMCCQKVFSTGFLDNALLLLKASKVAVENLDIESGPVRWKVTHGKWPLDNDNFEDLPSKLYEQFVPSVIKDLFESGGVDSNVNASSDNSNESTNTVDPLEQYGFIDSKEGFCPITLILDGEDNSKNNTSFVRGNRAMFDNIFDNIVSDRSYMYTCLSFIRSPIEKFQQFPQDLEASIGNLSTDSIKEIASIPGVDGQELVKFTTINQIANFAITDKIERPSSTLRYLPNKMAVSNNEYLVAKSFVGSYMHKNFNKKEMAVVQTVGIPCGYLNANNISSNFLITREAEYMFFPNVQWSKKTNTFNPFVYIIPGSFSRCNPNSDYEKIVQDARYYVSDGNLSNFMSFSECQEYFQMTQANALQCLTNHVLDAALKASLKITTGMDISEDTFRLNKETSQKYISPDGVKLIEKFINKFPSKYLEFFKDSQLKSIPKILKSDSESTILEINNFLAALDCRLITPEEIIKKVFSTRIFDRVFCTFAHPDEHYSLIEKDGLIGNDVTIDGLSRKVYQINLKDGTFNSIKNDHLASYYYRIQKI